MRLYKYLYYRLYSWNLKTWGENDAPQWNALIGVSFMMLLNLSTIGIALQFFKLTDFFIRDEIPKTELIFLMVGIGVFNFFQFIHHGKYEEISKEYEKEEPRKKSHNTVYLWLYTFGSFALFAGLAILYGKMNPFLSS